MISSAHTLDAIAIVLSYLYGSIPAGLWLGLRFRGVDIRQHGSGNIGATNTSRVLGKRLGLLALLFDVSKGLLAVLCFARMGAWAQLSLACGLAAILGHTFSVFLRFRGGKGVATSTGVFIGLAPLATLAAAIAFGMVFGLTRLVGAGSVVAALVLATVTLVLPGYDAGLRALAVGTAALVVLRHRGNIARMLRGTEHRM